MLNGKSVLSKSTVIGGSGLSFYASGWLVIYSSSPTLGGVDVDSVKVLVEDSGTPGASQRLKC